MRHGDWVGRWALIGVLLLYAAAAAATYVLPQVRARAQPRRA